MATMTDRERLVVLGAGVVLGAAMAAALVYGFGWGGGVQGALDLMQAPWFVVSLVDVYVGFLLFGGWVVFREASAARSAVWVVLLLTLGNIIACAYVLLALRGCGGSWERFWLGRRAEAQSQIHAH